MSSPLPPREEGGTVKRRKFLKRSTKPIARSRIRPKKRDAAQREKDAAKFAREYESVERVEWIKTLPSIASGCGPCENAHVRNGGTGRKADACWIVPLTKHEHRVELHRTLGRVAFERKYGVDLDVEAGKIDWRWRQRCARLVSQNASK